MMAPKCLGRDGLSLIEWAPLRGFSKSEQKGAFAIVIVIVLNSGPHPPTAR